MNNVQVLIAGTEEKSCRPWADHLRGRGWRVTFCRTITELARETGNCALSLILADESLAEGDLAGALKRFAAKNNPVILFSGGAAGSGKIAGYLRRGFDDLVPRDMDPRLLEAKLLVLLRWALPAASRQLEEVSSSSGRMRINKNMRRVLIKRSGGFSEVPGLTATELGILALLVRNEGEVVGRSRILEAVWKDRIVNFQNVDKHVEALRKKLCRSCGSIETVYGAGYCYKENR